MAKTTASANGTNRYRATPVRKNMGTNTMQIALDVFNFHRGIVHQYSHRQCQAAEGHDVESLAQRAQYDHRSENREWNGDGDDQRAAPVPEKKQNHSRRQARRGQGL